MSASFERLIDGIIDALQSHVVPNSRDDFVRGQVFSAIYALNGLKLAADWKAGPLLEQVRPQDDTFAAIRRLADGMAHPEIPAAPRIRGDISDAAAILGGALYSLSFLDMDLWAYLMATLDTLTQEDIMQGLQKSVVFAIIIALVGVSSGFAVSGGAEGVGRATTRSVVMSISWLVIADMVFTYFLNR